MDYRQLLNPKGFAKEKAKKQAPKYGPQQSRKPTASESTDPKPNIPKFDPKKLLNPRSAAGQSKPMDASVGTSDNPTQANGASIDMATADVESQPGVGSIIERIHGVSNREAPPLKKRKVSEEVDDDDEGKKTRSTISAVSGGGELGAYLRSEREKGAAESGPSDQPIVEPIDLTKEDDDDLIFVGEKLGEDSKEVCLGRLTASANAFRIPSIPKHQVNVLGSDTWPETKAEYRRPPQAKTNIIELYDRRPGTTNQGTKFGTMDVKVASALCSLFDGASFHKLRIKIWVDPFPKRPDEQAGLTGISRALPLSINLFAPKKFAAGIGKVLGQKQLYLSVPSHLDRGIDYFNPMVPQDFRGKPGLNGSTMRPQASSQPTFVTRTQEEMLREASNMFDSLVKSDELPEMEANSSLITTTLMAHQKQALHFLTQHERADHESSEDDPILSLWKPRTSKTSQQSWYNIITNHELPQKPATIRGGILADMMGLGKTLSILALVADTLDDARAFGEEEPPVELEEVVRNTKGTLIICPKSVMSNWEEQVKQHVKARKLKVYSYHGTARTQDVDELAKYHIVLTSYSTAAAEFSDKSYKRNALASLQWHRIVLDEAHQIRTQNTQASKACCALSAQRRWAVTGTPVQNRLDDLGSLIKFLRIKPFDESRNWAEHILAPFRNANENILRNLRLLVDSITLRRMKDKIGLRERRERIVRLDFSDEEMAIYSEFAKVTGRQVRLMLGDNKKLQGRAYSHILRSLLRLRLICAHGRELLNEDDTKELEGLTAATAIDLGDEPDRDSEDSFITEKYAYDTIHFMSESEVDLCTCCDRKIGDKKADPDAVADPTVDPNADAEDSTDESDDTESNEQDDVMGYLTPCFHLICPRCHDAFVAEASTRLSADNYFSCQYCDQYTRLTLFELRRSGLQAMLAARAPKNKKNGAKWDENSYSGPHTKVKALLEDLKRSEEESKPLVSAGEPPIRSVVFSGWTAYLDLIEHALDNQNINHVRLDGTMSLRARSAVLQTFKTDPNTTVLLVSIKAGGQGLNFTAANKVYMMEPQFNPGVEQQAIDRVHRLGQQRDVDIVHYIMRASVEEHVLGLQEKKEKLAKLSLERKHAKGEEAKLWMAELKELCK